MGILHRRDFLRGGAAALAWAASGGASRLLRANPLGLPIGLELYTVRQQFLKDPKGTLAAVAAIGYGEVELFSFGRTAPADLKAMVSAAGLKAPSGHTSAQALSGNLDATVAQFRDAGLDYMICAFPAVRPGVAQPLVRIAGRPFVPTFELEDYKWMAGVFNKAGAKCQEAGLQLGYHCHNLDFKEFDGQPALDYLLQNTDAKLVQLEHDCFWVARAGKDPVDYMKRYAGRVPILHIKDMKPGLTPTTDITQGGGDAFTEVGKGVIDWKRIFAAAPDAGVKHYFVEQDKCDGQPMDCARASYEYLKNMPG